MTRLALLAMVALASSFAHAGSSSYYESHFDPTLSEVERIRAHLGCTVEYLSAQPTDALTDDQAANRAEHINVLSRYAEAGSFPVNETSNPFTPIFIDNAGTACAVGHLMIESGSGSLAREISTCENLAYVPEITHPGVLEWVESSGLTLDECALIQPTYLAAFIDEITCQSDADGVRLEWVIGEGFDASWVTIDRDGVEILQLYGAELDAAAEAYVDTSASYGVHEYRVYASDGWYWDEHFCMIDHTEKWFTRGDANGNGEIEGIADPVYLLSYAFVSGPPPPCLEAADSNGDGTIEGIVDALYVMYYVFAEGPPPPLPFPNCEIADAGGHGCAAVVCP